MAGEAASVERTNVPAGPTEEAKGPLTVVVKGAGDLGSGVAWRLHRCGFPVVALEKDRPTVIRRAVSFAAAIYEGEITVEGVTGRRATVDEVTDLLGRGVIPVLVDPEGGSLPRLRPAVLVDAILAKRNRGTRIDDAPLVIALGPGFQAGHDCHAVIETARGHFLGRVYWQGATRPNTGLPGPIMGVTEERVLRAPMAGTFRARAQIGDLVQAGQAVAQVDGRPVEARIDGAIRGLLHDGLAVHAQMKVGDVDPRGRRAYCFTVSDKALAIGGGVLEAIVAWMERSRKDLGREEQATTHRVPSGPGDGQLDRLA